MKKTGFLGYLGDYTTQYDTATWRLFHKPGRKDPVFKTKKVFMKSKGPRGFFVAHLLRLHPGE